MEIEKESTVEQSSSTTDDSKNDHTTNQASFPESTPGMNESESKTISKYREEVNGEHIDAIEPSDAVPPSLYDIMSCMYARDTSGMLYKAVVRKKMYACRLKIINEENVGLVEDDKNTNENLDERDKVWYYFVHFIGWNVKWDMWLTEDTLFDDCPETRELAKVIKSELKKGGKHVARKLRHLEEEYRANEIKRKNPKVDNRNMMSSKIEDLSKKKVNKTKSGQKRQAKLFNSDLELPRQQNLANRILLPMSLKKVLVDEWEIVTQAKRVPHLPAVTSIKAVLEKYLASKSEDPEIKEDQQQALFKDNVTVSINEVNRKDYQYMVDSLSQHFNKVLPVRLLYRQEVLQYKILCSKPKSKHVKPCEIYGCEYLLRLLVKLPGMIETEGRTVPEKELARFYAMIGDLVRFLQKDQFSYFRQQYRKPDDNEVVELQEFLCDNCDGKGRIIKKRNQVNEDQILSENTKSSTKSSTKRQKS